MFFVLVTRDQPGGVEELEFIRNPITRPWSLDVSTSFQRSHASETNDSTRVELPMITRFRDSGLSYPNVSLFQLDSMIRLESWRDVKPLIR